MEPYKIYLSYREEDAKVAYELANILRRYGGGNIWLTLSEKTGLWTKYILDELNRAELLIVLRSDPSGFSTSVDWSLFEFGYFSGIHIGAKKKKILILSPPDLEVPSPLTEFQNLGASKDDAKSFLQELFGGTTITGRDAPINIYFAEDHRKVSEVAGQIYAMIAPKRRGARMHANSLILKFGENLLKPAIPENVEVEVDPISVKMFGLLWQDRFSWGDIQRSLHGETRWVTELTEAIHAIMNRRQAKPIRSTFPSAEGKSYIPVVYRDEARFGLSLFHVLFVPTDLVPVDPKLVFVITAFKSDMEPVYEAIEAAVSNFSLSAKRVKDIVGDYRITDKILNLLSQAKYVVADLTHERPNVYFELGYARGLGKTVITTVRKGTTVHFDVKDWTYIEYDDSRTLERELMKRLKAEEGPEEGS